MPAHQRRREPLRKWSPVSLLAALLGALWLGAGCGRELPPPQDPQAVPEQRVLFEREVIASPPAPASTEAASQNGNPLAVEQRQLPERTAFLQQYRALEGPVTRIRNLAPTAQVELEVIDRDALRRFFLEKFEQDYLPQERDSDQRLLSILGLVPEDVELVSLLLDLYEEQVLGFYDQDTKRMYVVSDVSAFGPEQKLVYAHEFVHALQDQHYDLAVLAPSHPDNEDRSLAIHALIEGDASVVTELYAVAELRPEELRGIAAGASTDKLSSAPLVVREELLFPYTDGRRFVGQLVQQGGYAAVDDAFADPPQSTEQILHAEKYRAREAPVAVVLEDLAQRLGPGWEFLDSNILGELDVRILVQQYTDRQVAARAAAGWGGDRWQLLKRGDESAVVVRTVWDTGRDAVEFYEAMRMGLRSRFPEAPAVQASSTSLRVSTDKLWAGMWLKNETVTLVLVPDAGTGQLVAAALGL